MFRKTQPDLIRYVVLSWTADGGSVTKALSQLGFKTYSLRQMLTLKENGKRHPQLWANMLRPQDEFFEAKSAPVLPGNREMTSAAHQRADGGLGVQQKLESFNKVAMRLGVQSTKKIAASDLADYDAIAGLPVSALPPSVLVDLFPKYTKFILVEGQQNAPEWTTQHLENGMVPILTSLSALTGEGATMRKQATPEEEAEAEAEAAHSTRAQRVVAAAKRRGPKASASPTAKVWLSLFRHFAWPGSGPTVLETMPHDQNKANIQSGFVGSPVKAAMAMVSNATKDDGREVVARVSDIGAVKERKELAESALANWERDIKETVPPEQLFVFREGMDSWPELCFMVNKAEMIPEKEKKEFPKTSYGTDYLAQVRRQIARADVKMKVANVLAALAVAYLMWELNGFFTKIMGRLAEDARVAAGKKKVPPPPLLMAVMQLQLKG